MISIYKTNQSLDQKIIVYMQEWMSSQSMNNCLKLTPHYWILHFD